MSDNIISALGFTTAENMAAMHQYKSGIALHKRDDIASTPIQAALIDRDKLATMARERELSNYSLLEQLFILSIADTLAQAGMEHPEAHTALILSTTKGNVDTLANTAEVPSEAFLSHTAQRVAAYWGIDAQDTVVVSNACISGVSALVIASRLIGDGSYNNIIVAGGDVLSPFITSGFLSFKSISTQPCRPYDARRDGLNLGEACGSVLLSGNGNESDIAITGGAITNDANHISGPSRTGDGLYYAIRNAMNEAGVTVEDVTFVNAHGTATAYNDEMESKAIHWAQLQEKPVNSMKSYFGHTLGASGVIESIVCAHALQENFIPGTLNYSECGVPCPLVVSDRHIEGATSRVCVKTASGFGGCNAALILQKGSVHPQPTTLPATTECVSVVEIDNATLKVDNNIGYEATDEDKSFATFIRGAYKSLDGKNQKFYKMSDLCKLGYVAAEALLQNCINFAPEEVGIILSNRSASIDTDRKHQDIISSDGESCAAPAVFVYTLPNVVAGEIAIRHKIQGENTFFIQEEYDAAWMENYARKVMAHDNLKYCIVGRCELLKENYHAEFKLIKTI